MARELLTDAKAKKLSTQNGKHSDGAGLTLFVRGNSVTWTYRFTLNGKRGEMGLGSYPTVSLADARKLRDEYAVSFKAGIDPRQAAVPAIDTRFGSLVDSAFEAKKAELKGAGKNGRWMSPVETVLLPVFRDRDITTITAPELADAIRPYWVSRNGVGEKALQRFNVVLEHAESREIDVDYRLTRRARNLLGKINKKAQHIPALPWKDTPAFYASLGNVNSELALRLLILTATRSQSVRGATPEQFDLVERIWTIPPENMKNSREFRVPLSDEAVNVVEQALQFMGADDAFLFPGRSGKPMSDMTLTKRLNDRGMKERPHGFRSTFRDWGADNEKSRDLSEMALAHSVGSEVERAYRRSDQLELRRTLMQDWADFVKPKQIEFLAAAE